MKRRSMIAAGAVLLGLAGVLYAQSTGITRTIVARGDASVPGREAVVASVEIAGNGVVGWHTHPGDEMSYVVEGDITLMMAGQAPKKYKAGEGFLVPAGTVHSAKNENASATHLVGVYYVEKGKPLASPAPAPAN